MAEWVYTGTNGPIGGEGITGPDAESARRQVRHHDVNASQKGASARLYNQLGDWISLWVYEVEASFQMAGTRVQSAQLRDFYPHNFVQPALTVRGQTANNYEFNRLSEFIRFAQRRGVFFSEHGLDRPTIDFALFARGHDTKRGHKGAHQKLNLQGVVPAFGRGAKRFQYAHDYEFDFIITRSLSGLMEDQDYTARKLLSWAEVVTPLGGGLVQRSSETFQADPDKADKAAVSRLLNFDPGPDPDTAPQGNVQLPGHQNDGPQA